ncbi:hypothetical protein [Heterobasidion ambi-like virus 4]|nr:hypothetical protein [Heterobasidion ambi-like virus 4]
MSTLFKSFVMTGHFDLALLTESLPYIPIHQRKFLLTFCRIQDASNYRFLGELSKLESEQRDTFIYRDTICHLRDVIDNIAKYRHQPLTLGLISMIVRVVYHADLNELEAAMQNSFDKEFLAATTTSPEPQLDFSCIFSTNVEDRDIPISPLHNPSPTMGFKLHVGLMLLRDKMMREQPLIPTYARRKNVSQSMARDFCSVSNSLLQVSEITSLECLREYARGGVKAGGHTEMRSVFRYTDLAPRTYYATGGDAYWDAMYMKKFCYELTTLLPTCSPKDHIRYDITRLDYHPGNTVFLYDYSSFTSSLPGMDKFTNDLATFFEGCYIQIFDPYEGVLHADFAEMIRKYNVSINRNLPFDVRRLVEDYEGEANSFYMANNGPLGAQGNINLSMFLHAIVITAATDNLNRQNCVGDDAIVVFDERRVSRSYFIGIVNLLGTINETKMVWMKAMKHHSKGQREAEGWHFMKRPIVVYWEYIWVGTLIDFPSCAMWERRDPYHIDTGYRDQEMDRFVLQCGAFFDQALLHQIDIKGEEMELGLEVLRILYNRLWLPARGSFPGLRHKGSNTETYKLAIPALAMENYAIPWKKVLWDGIDDVEGFLDVERAVDQIPMRLGYDWRDSTKTRLMSILADFGFGEMALVKRWYSRSYEDRLLWLDSDRLHTVYRFRLCDNLTDPFVQLLTAYNHVSGSDHLMGVAA